jgi:pyridoxal phosphate enzyme (YggS family)
VASIKENIIAVQQDIARAAEAAGFGEVSLLAATKTRTAAEINQAVAAGLYEIGENRVQELLAKADEVDSRAQWHFIGHLQRNKVRQVVGKVDLIQSVGSDALLTDIARQAEKLGIVQDILLEVNVGGEEAKSGYDPAEIPAAAALVKNLPAVRLRGLMTVPPIAEQPGDNLGNFQKVYRIYVDINQKLYDNTLDTLSMGMSGDFSEAIRAGATMVRVGTSIFGHRAYPAAKQEGSK